MARHGISLGRCSRGLVIGVSWVVASFVVAALPPATAEAAKLEVQAEADLFGPYADDVAATFEVRPLTGEQPTHPVIVDGYDSPALAAATLAAVRAAYLGGVPILVVSPTMATQGLLDDLTGSEVDLRDRLATALREVGAPRLDGIGIRRRNGLAEIAEFWVAFDNGDGPSEEERQEDRAFVESLATWLSEESGAAPVALARAQAAEGRPAIDDVTNAVVRKVAFQFDQGSMAVVVRSWAAYAPGTDEDWYIFELTTTSQPLNFATFSAPFVWDPWEKTDAYCRAILKTSCKRDRYATRVDVKIAPKTSGLELVYYGPDSDREQNEYSYSSTFSLGGKVTAGYDDKGAKAGVELSAGASFTRSTKVTIKDATLVGKSNPALEIGAWSFEMPRMRAVNDLSAYGGPVQDCDNLLQMPYPVQRGAMESKQYAIYRLPASDRRGLTTIDLKVSLALEESVSWMTNWTAGQCNFFNCACTPQFSVVGLRELNDSAISFPLAAHPR